MIGHGSSSRERRKHISYPLNWLSLLLTPPTRSVSRPALLKNNCTNFSKKSMVKKCFEFFFFNIKSNIFLYLKSKFVRSKKCHGKNKSKNIWSKNVIEKTYIIRSNYLWEKKYVKTKKVME